MVSDSGATITYNQEIYNYVELAAHFEVTYPSQSDTEVLLKLFDRFGIAAISLCNQPLSPFKRHQ